MDPLQGICAVASSAEAGAGNSTAIIGLSIAVVILLMMSAFFSATETAYSSMNRIKLKAMAQEGNKKAKRALLISNNYDNFLTTILIGNNIVNIVSASLSTILFGMVIANQELSVTVSTVVMTALTLIFGEISPKSLAKESPENFAMAVANVTQVLCVILSPLAYLFSLWKKLLVLIFKPKQKEGMSEAELITIVDEATCDGNINEAEGELIRSAIEFNELTVRDILTPRVEVVGADITTDKAVLRQLFKEHGFSRMPIYDGDIDHIIGVLHEKDFYNNYFEKDFDIRDSMSNIICVTLTATLSNVLQMLQKSKTHMAAVIDEFGGTAGIVTLEDIIEEIVGEIWDEHDEVIEDVVTVGDREYQVDGACDIEDLFDRLNHRYDSDELEFTTVSGWVLDHFGYIPKVGEEFTEGELLVKVIDADGRKIERVYIKQGEVKEIGETNFLDKLFIRDEKDKREKEEPEEPPHADDESVETVD